MARHDDENRRRRRDDMRSILKDGERMRVRMTDSSDPQLARAMATHFARVTDGARSGDPLRLRQPGYRVSDADQAARDEAYRQYDEDLVNSWRNPPATHTSGIHGAGEHGFMGAPEVGAIPVGPGARPGDQCTVRSGGNREGSRGRLVEVAPGWLACRPVERDDDERATSDSRRDGMSATDAAYRDYDDWVQQQWKTPL